MKALMWFYQWHVLGVYMEDSLEDAFSSALSMEDAGEGVVDVIEHDGKKYTTASPEFKAYEKKRRTEEIESLRKFSKTVLWTVEVKNGKWYTLGTYRDEAAAEADHAAVQKDFPDKEIRLVKRVP